MVSNFLIGQKVMLVKVIILFYTFILTAECNAKPKKKIVIDKKHLKLDFLHIFGSMAEMFSDIEMDFGYFAAHDYDQNKKLDGLELLKAFGHEDQHETDTNKNNSVLSELENQVDDIFDEHDLDNDGFLNYKEFLSVERFHTDVDSAEKIAEKSA